MTAPSKRVPLESVAVGATVRVWRKDGRTSDLNGHEGTITHQGHGDPERSSQSTCLDADGFGLVFGHWLAEVIDEPPVPHPMAEDGSGPTSGRHGCDDCDWTFGCFAGTEPCRKRPALDAAPGVDASSMIETSLIATSRFASLKRAASAVSIHVECDDIINQLADEVAAKQRGFEELHRMVPGNFDIWTKVDALIKERDAAKSEIARLTEAYRRSDAKTTQLTNTELDALEKACEGTTAAPWFFAYSSIYSEPLNDEHARIEREMGDDPSDDDPRWDQLPETALALVSRVGGDTPTLQGARDGHFIALANPATVRRLIAEVRVARVASSLEAAVAVRRCTGTMDEHDDGLCNCFEI